MKAFHKNKPKAERRFTGEYAPDGKAKRLAVREASGHRCVRCHHPFKSGEHGKGEWSPCDVRCEHRGPIGMQMEDGVLEIKSNESAGVIAMTGVLVVAQWRILTVHHLDGCKSNDNWANTLALCQRCHLEIQGKVDPRIPWFLEHSTWFKPYAAAFYAKKYLDQILSREEVMQRLDELLQLERIA